MASLLRPDCKSVQVLWVVCDGASVLLQMAWKVGEESLVFCSERVKNRYRIQGFARWRWLLQVAGIAKTGGKNKKF